MKKWVLNENNYNLGLGGWGGNLGVVVNESKSKTVTNHWENGVYDNINWSERYKENYKNNPERRIKLSKSLKKYYSVNDRYNKGISPSNATKIKLSNKTTLFWKEYREKINIPLLQFSKNGIFIKEWNNLSEASLILNIQHRTLYKIINQNIIDDFIWKYKTNNN